MTLDYAFLYREQHRPFCGRAHGLFGKSVADARTLSVEAFVLAGSEEPEAVTLYRERFGWGKRCAAQSPYLEEVRRLVVAGLGIGFLPEEMLEHDVGSGLLWPLMEADEEAQNDVFVVSNPQGSRQARRAVFPLDPAGKCVFRRGLIGLPRSARRGPRGGAGSRSGISGSIRSVAPPDA